jgi:catechol 2,3-dioxygenase-like lactoylglutathione lyase family enzyme
MVLDHTIVLVQDPDAAVRFYTSILGLRDGGKVGELAIVYVNDSLILGFREGQDVQSRHYAFAMDADEFERIFQRLKDAGILYGDRAWTVGNMQGPGLTPGARGPGKSIYFRDPSQHLLEIRTY